MLKITIYEEINRHIRDYVHRILMESLQHVKTGYEQYDHMDGNRHNNKYLNLQPATPSIQRESARRNGIKVAGPLVQVVRVSEDGQVDCFASVNQASAATHLETLKLSTITLRSG